MNPAKYGIGYATLARVRGDLEWWGMEALARLDFDEGTKEDVLLIAAALHAQGDVETANALRQWVNGPSPQNAELVGERPDGSTRVGLAPILDPGSK